MPICLLNAAKSVFGLAVLCVLVVASWMLVQASPQSTGGKKEAVDPDTVRALIAQLGDSSFAKRQEASERLANIGQPALELLRKAAKESNDPEIRDRAARLIREIRGDIRVGILHSLTGTMAISEKALRDAELMAIEEINKSGGVLGKQIEPIVEDPQSRFTDVFPLKARKLVLDYKVDVIFGCWTSVSRKNVLPVVEQNNSLLFYPVSYEGMECSKNVVYSGPLPNQQILPAVKWLLEKGYKKFYLVGSNYIFPRVTNLIIVKYLDKYGKGAKAVAEEYTELGWTKYERVVQNILHAKPDVIISTVNGDSNTNFYKELAAQGITPGDVDKPRSHEKQIPVVSVTIGEDELRDLNPAEVRGHLAAASYFQSVATPSNKAFVKAFKKRYGGDRITFAEVASAYAQVYLWKLAVEKGKSTSTEDVRNALRVGITFDAPEGRISIDPKTQHMTKYFRLGRIREDRQFDIIYESPQTIEPDPYPQVAFPGRHCDWTTQRLKPQ